MTTNTEAATTANEGITTIQGWDIKNSSAEAILLQNISYRLPNYAPFTREGQLKPYRELVAAIRAEERAKVEREWQERVQKLHRRAQAAESEMSKLEYLRALLDTTATEQVRRLHKHSQALWSACERQKAEQAALWEKVKPILSTIANAKRDVYGSAPTLWVFDDAQETAREALAAMDAARGGGDE